VKHRITITFHLSTSNAEPTLPVEQARGVLLEIEAQLQQKKVVLDKLRKLNVGIRILKTAGDVLGNVSSPMAIFW
jgi:hypothetical protein